MSNQNILIGQIKAEAENLLKEKKSLEKSSNNFEQQTMGLNKNLQKKTNECEIMNKSLNAQHAEIYKLLGDLNERWKTLKLKEKNIHDTVKKSDVLDETCKRRKEAISSLKQEKKELEKKLKNLNKLKEPGMNPSPSPFDSPSNESSSYGHQSFLCSFCQNLW